MIEFINPVPNNQENQWRSRLDSFAKEHQIELAALSWGLYQEWGENSQDILGIDLKPTPHFIRTSRDSVEKLNEKVEQKLKEILGILDGYKPQEEVVIIGVGEGQVKLIYFKLTPAPPDCFTEIQKDLDSLISDLEEKMLEYFQIPIEGELS